jgi:hypothetical protein
MMYDGNDIYAHIIKENQDSAFP